MARAVFSWGRGEDGQLGLGDTSDQYRPVSIDALADEHVVQVACGSGHTVVLTEGGCVYTWGRGDDGRLGHGDNGWKYVPRLVEALQGRRVQQVTCGSYHTAAVVEGGDLYTWGGGMYGKLGHGNESGHSTPCLVEALRGQRVEQIACGSRHTVVLLETHEVFTWGDKENGVSGHGDTDGHQYLPREVATLSGAGVKQVAACGFHTAAVTERGEVYTWGEGKFGRLGHGTERNQPTPRLVEALLGVAVKQVACGGFHTAAVAETGEMWTWGGGEHGQLGHGEKHNKVTPCMIEALRDTLVVQLTCGWSHTVGLSDAGLVYTFGNGDHGKLGHGDVLKLALPRVVEALRGKHVCSVASYNEHTAALTNPDAVSRASVLTSSFLGDLRRLIDNAEFSDVTFVVEERPVHAHRAVLATRSEYFGALFRSGMRESRRDHEIVLPLRHNVFLALLEYIYIDVVDVAPELAVELYIAADLYTLDRLKGLSEVIVQKGLRLENAAALLQLADEMQASRLRELCVGYVVNHFDAVSKTEGFQQLSRELIIEILQSR